MKHPKLLAMLVSSLKPPAGDGFNNINTIQKPSVCGSSISRKPCSLLGLSIRTQLLSTVTTLADPTSVPWRSDGGGDGLMRGDMLPSWLEISRIIEPYQHCESKQFLFSGYMKPYSFFSWTVLLVSYQGAHGTRRCPEFQCGGHRSVSLFNGVSNCCLIHHLGNL